VNDAERLCHDPAGARGPMTGGGGFFPAMGAHKGSLCLSDPRRFYEGGERGSRWPAAGGIRGSGAGYSLCVCIQFLPSSACVDLC
jgi:hypothetical protein